MPCRLVAEAIKKVEGTRRCYRLVGGVLVERTASEVLPAVENNAVKVCCYWHTSSD